MTTELQALHALAGRLGVATHYIDGLRRRVDVSADTLVRVCAALGAPIGRIGDALDAWRSLTEGPDQEGLPPVLIAWDGVLPPLEPGTNRRQRGQVRFENGETLDLGRTEAMDVLPFGYHELSVEAGGRRERCTVISAPVAAWQEPGAERSWGVGTHLAALRSARSRALADLRDLEALCRWIRNRGGNLVTALPLLPTFNTAPPEPSPYSPVSRLFWSELILDLGEAHHPVAPPATLDVARADAEVRRALAGQAPPPREQLDPELLRYARFRGAQIRLGRNWRDWPEAARRGKPAPDDVDPEEERFHLVAQPLIKGQLRDLRQRLELDGMRLGLDLAVGVHPDGYDPWSRQSLFAEGMSVGAPPDQGFPSGQDWGFSPVHPVASRLQGHEYLAASIAQQASLAGVLRIDHIMAWTRLYWIPHGFGLHEGTYVRYPAEELFAILTLESHRHRCEIVGENLGTVPPEIDQALPRHRIRGMYLAQFEAPKGEDILPPTSADVAMIGTHDTPTFAGWLAGNDIVERVDHRLLSEPAAPDAAEERTTAAGALAAYLGTSVGEPREMLARLLEWLGRSDSSLVVPWLEDLWLEDRGVNLPGTRSSERPNWQRPMARLLEDIFQDPDVNQLVARLEHARRTGSI